jgi:hypothetical protein
VQVPLHSPRRDTVSIFETADSKLCVIHA